MDYGSILSNAWNTIWNKKHLMVLGILMGLGINGGIGGVSYLINGLNPAQTEALLEQGGYYRTFTPEQLQLIASLTGPLMIVCGVAWLLVGIALWFSSRTATGGLIAGVGRQGEVAVTGFGQSWMVGWERVWRMAGLGLITLIPTWVIMIPYYVLSMFWQQQQQSIIANPERLDPTAFYAYYLEICGLLCVALLIGVPLWILQQLAERACMLEDTSLSGSIKRAWQIVRSKVGAILVLWLIQVGIALGIGLIVGIIACGLVFCMAFIAALLPPLMLLMLCVLLPVYLILLGVMYSYYSTMWTLAWNEWAADVPASGSMIEAPATPG